MPQNAQNLRQNEAQARVRQRMGQVDDAVGAKLSDARRLMQQVTRQRLAQTTDAANSQR